MKENGFFNEVHGNFGFGCMRLPMCDKEVDIEQTKHMADRFIEAGFNYFDTAHGYIGGKSELAIKECVAARYPRDSFLLTDKLTGPYFEKEDDKPLSARNASNTACGASGRETRLPPFTGSIIMTGLPCFSQTS